MDITRPPLDRQVAPAPWLVYRGKLDAPAAIRQILTEKPDATVDEIADALETRGMQVSRMVVAMWLPKLRVETGLAAASPAAAAESPAAE